MGLKRRDSRITESRAGVWERRVVGFWARVGRRGAVSVRRVWRREGVGGWVEVRMLWRVDEVLRAVVWTAIVVWVRSCVFTW